MHRIVYVWVTLVYISSSQCKQPYTSTSTDYSYDYQEPRTDQITRDNVNVPILDDNYQVPEYRRSDFGPKLSEQVTRPDRDRVVFPGPTSKSSYQFVPDIPEHCMKTGICEDLPAYPEDRVAAIIDGLGDARNKYKVDELDGPEVAQRIGPPEETELCDFNLTVVVPRAAQDKDGNWHYIVNQKEKPLQGFRVEICRENYSPCSKLAHFYRGYEASCKQKYVLRYMTGLNEKGEPIEKLFKLPSCCSCIVRQTD